MQTLKAFHVIFMVTWFAGLFYLPRLFIYHVATRDQPGLVRFRVMEWRLWVITTIGAVLTVLSGLWLTIWAWWPPTAGWLVAKLALVAGLLIYHAYCFYLIRQLRHGPGPHSQRFLRLFNEIPAVALIGIVLLAMLKPF